MSIRQLPQDVVDRLKSSVTITSLHDVAAGLLKNSLDAGATKVTIFVDFSRGNCTVEDNGRGIEPEEFKDTGGLGKLHREYEQVPPSCTVVDHGRHVQVSSEFRYLWEERQLFGLLGGTITALYLLSTL